MSVRQYSFEFDWQKFSDAMETIDWFFNHEMAIEDYLEVYEQDNDIEDADDLDAMGSAFELLKVLRSIR